MALSYEDARRTITARYGIGRTVFKNDCGVALAGNARPSARRFSVDTGNVHVAQRHSGTSSDGDMSVASARTGKRVTIKEQSLARRRCDGGYRVE